VSAARERRGNAASRTPAIKLDIRSEPVERKEDFFVRNCIGFLPEMSALCFGRGIRGRIHP